MNTDHTFTGPTFIVRVAGEFAIDAQHIGDEFNVDADIAVDRIIGRYRNVEEFIREWNLGDLTVTIIDPIGSHASRKWD